MFKKHGGKILMALVALLVGGFLVVGTVPALAAGNGLGNCTGMGTGRGGNGNSLAAITSDMLGISRSDLAVERQAGKSLVAIAGEKGIGQEELVNSVLAKRQAVLEQALKDQKISEAQYNQCVQEMKENIEQNLTRIEVGPNGNGKGNGQGLKNGMGQGRAQGQGQGQGRYCQQ